MGFIKIGAMVNGDMAVKWLPKLIEYKFESIAVNYFSSSGDTDFAELAKRVKDAIGDSGITVSAVSVYCNPLKDEAGIREWEKCIDNAKAFGSDLVTGFAGRLDGLTVEENIPRFKEVFAELGRRALDNGVKLAFENCYMGGNWKRGNWNIANSPLAWDMMFEAVPLDNIGIEWEPAHQIHCLRDPLNSLKKYAGKIFHVHGKDANVDWDTIREFGTDGAKKYTIERFPGHGDADWKQILTILYKNNYTGTVDIEGFHDRFFKGELEFSAHVASLNYLKVCRGGEFIPNP